MPNSPSHDRLLRIARSEFDAQGRISYDTAVRLMAQGVMVQQLEDHWARNLR